MKNKRKWDLLNEEKKRQCIDEIITYFEKTRYEKIGIIAAEELLDFFMQIAAEDIYNKAMYDAKKLLKERFEDLEVELDILSSK